MNNFTRIEGNRICRKIGWRTGPEAEMMCEAFRNGETGFPWIDASIRKMRQDGWIHHLCRMSLATFLTIGHMWCSWEVGQQVRRKNMTRRISTRWLGVHLKCRQFKNGFEKF